MRNAASSRRAAAGAGRAIRRRGPRDGRAAAGASRATRSRPRPRSTATRTGAGVWLLCLAVILGHSAIVQPAQAEMKVRLKDGRVLTLPVNPEDVDSVTFGPPSERSGAAPPAGAAGSRGGAATSDTQPVDRAARRIRADDERIRNARDAEQRAKSAADRAMAASKDAAEAAAAARQAAASASGEARAAAEARRAAESLAQQAPATASPPTPGRHPGQAAPSPGGEPGATADEPTTSGRTLKVGPGEKYALPSQAARAARDGDVIEIAAAHYRGDVAVWTARNLVLRGVGGRPHIDAQGAAAEGKAVWVIKGENVLVENVELSNCRVADLNGAGIRAEGLKLTVRDSYFHDNQVGILSHNDGNAEVVIEGSEFSANTLKDPNASPPGHNIYIGQIRSFVLRGSYVHSAAQGHNVKTRARSNAILFNRLVDGDDGAASYIVDFAEGGDTVMTGNVIQQGRRAENEAIVSFAAERRGSKDRLVMLNNTLVNDLDRGVFVRNAGSAPALLVNNIFAGPGVPLSGAGHLAANLVASRTSVGLIGAITGSRKARPGDGALAGNLVAPVAGFVAPEKMDFRLTSDSPARDAGGQAPSGLELPDSEYRHPLQVVPRVRAGKPDIGAFEFGG